MQELERMLREHGGAKGCSWGTDSAKLLLGSLKAPPCSVSTSMMLSTIFIRLKL